MPEILEINLVGWARMMVLFGITLPGHLWVELKIFFYVKAWQDCSGPGQDDGIILGIIFFWAGQLGHWQPEPASSTWYYFIPGRLLTLPGQALDRY